MLALRAVVFREARIRVTNAVFIFWDLLSPLAYLLVFGVGIDAALGPPVAMSGIDYNAFFLAGVLAMAAVQGACSFSYQLDSLFVSEFGRDAQQARGLMELQPALSPPTFGVEVGATAQHQERRPAWRDQRCATPMRYWGCREAQAPRRSRAHSVSSPRSIIRMPTSTIRARLPALPS